MSGIICELLHHVSGACTSLTLDMKSATIFALAPSSIIPWMPKNIPRLARLSKMTRVSIRFLITCLSKKFESWFVNLLVRLIAFEELGGLN
jgi:hypothetical protein